MVTILITATFKNRLKYFENLFADIREQPSLDGHKFCREENTWR